jgi:hypothetical protein
MPVVWLATQHQMWFLHMPDTMRVLARAISQQTAVRQVMVQMRVMAALGKLAVQQVAPVVPGGLVAPVEASLLVV